MIELIFKYKAKAYLLFWYAFLLIIHFVLKDRFLPLIFIFNACSLMVIIIYGYFLAVSLFKHKKISIALFCLNSLVAIYWYNNYHFTTEDSTINQVTDTHSIFYWNISRPDRLPLDIIFKNIDANNPEIIVFVEAKDISREDLKTFTRHYPSYEIQQLEGEMMIAINGEINSVEYVKISRSSNANFVTSTIQDHSIKIFITDLFADPAASKKKDFKAIKSFIASKNVDFIIGDFNTPYESINFNSFKTDFESFHKYNNGITATWPAKLPFLEIDHIWLSKKWKPKYLHKEFRSASDHGLLVGKYQLKTEI